MLPIYYYWWVYFTGLIYENISLDNMDSVRKYLVEKEYKYEDYAFC